MKRLLYILLFLIPFVSSGQEAFFQHNYTASGGGGGWCGDTEADNYLTAVTAFVTPTTTQKNAVCSLVASSKGGTNTWNEMVGMYPLIWSNASADAINLRNPGTYNLSFFGSPTHTSSGIDWNGSSQYANTGIAGNVMGQNDNHLAVYIQENNMTDANDIGLSGSSVSLALRINPTSVRFYPNAGFSSINFSYLGTQGMFLGTRTASNVLKMFKNGAQIGSTNTTASTGTATQTVYLGARNNLGTADLYCPRKSSYYSVGYGMTDAQVAENNTIIEQFHDDLGIGVQP